MTEEKKEPTLDEVLGTGITLGVLLTEKEPEGRFPGLADKFNLHIGKPYRFIIAGSNPMDQLTYDGIMTKLCVMVDAKGFTIKKLVLEKGLTFTTHSEKKPFEREEFKGPNDPEEGYRLIGFGSIIDADGFYRVRERIVKGQGGK